MTIILNGSVRELPEQAMTISELLTFLDLGARPVLVEKNGVAILQREFDRECVTDQDGIEIVRMVAGG